MTKKLFGISILSILLNACGHDIPNSTHNDSPTPPKQYTLALKLIADGKLQPSRGTLFSISDVHGNILASAGLTSVWNSYCANDPTELHLFTTPQYEIEHRISNLGKPSNSVKSAYSLVKKGELNVIDMANLNQFTATKIDSHQTTFSQVAIQLNSALTGPRFKCQEFEAFGIKFSSADSFVKACRNIEKDQIECQEIAIAKNTWVYTYGISKSAIIAITNFGDVLIYNNSKWCRAIFDSNKYACPNQDETAEIVERPTGRQFYSAIVYGEKTLIGSWPEGRLYEFEGDQLSPFNDDAPFYDYDSPSGREAQSLANYCGDLYVGYWPRGELWRKDVRDSQWKFVHRFFQHPTDAWPFIPYITRSPDGLPGSFYGQRITSLSLGGPYLFASTSNLGDWRESIRSDFLSEPDTEQYGMTYSIERDGCLTTNIAIDQSPLSLQFEFSELEIRIIENGVTIGHIKNRRSTIPDQYSIITIGDGIFGNLAGAKIEIQN